VSGAHGTALIRPEATVQMILHAYALGVRVFDTGPSYGAGEAERRLGEALARLPPYDPIVATKVGLQSSGIKRRERDFSADAVRRSVEGSLKRLRRARIDCLYLHGPDENELTDTLLRALADLRREGRVVSVGVCGRGADLPPARGGGTGRYRGDDHGQSALSAAGQRRGDLASGARRHGVEPGPARNADDAWRIPVLGPERGRRASRHHHNKQHRPSGGERLGVE
jgi:hypothetical protein